MCIGQWSGSLWLLLFDPAAMGGNADIDKVEAASGLAKPAPPIKRAK
jgi:hypothetical protein